MIFTNKVYDVMKSIALIWLPAIGTLYFAIAGIWGLPFAEQIVGTIMVLDTFLGAILGITTSQYNKTSSSTSNVQGMTPLEYEAYVAYQADKTKAEETQVVK